MLEQWKIGILGSGKLRQWLIGKTLLTRKLMNEKLPCKIIIPLSQVRGSTPTASKNSFNFDMF
jgi:hypothetical protein